MIFDIVENIIKECRICRSVLILKNTRKVLLASLPQSSIDLQEAYCWTKKLNTEDDGVDWAIYLISR